MQILTIPQELCDLNKYINAERTNKYLGAKIKKTETESVALYAIQQKLKKVDSAVFLEFTWHSLNRKKDKDNIAFAKKFILDGLVKARILKNDGYNDILGFSDNFVVSNEVKVVVIIKEKKELG